MVMAVQLSALKVSKRFGRRQVLRDISLSVQSGESLVVTGRNGSGKTTLMRVLAGLLQPSGGKVELHIDEVACDLDVRRQVIGFVTPEVQVYSELSPLENLQFLNSLRGLKWDKAEARHLLDWIGLSSREDDSVGEFSSGMKQRVKLACAISHQPPVLLLDEPGSNLDEAGRQVITKVIEDQRQRGITILATNDAEELGFGDTVLTLGQ